jgi:hypothetical protein
MLWRYEQRVTGMLYEGVPRIRHTLINEDGVSIWAAPSRDTWVFVYTRNGDEIRFNVNRKNNLYNVDEPLSGACELIILTDESERKFESLSRDIKEQIVSIVIDCIIHADIFPGKKPMRCVRVMRLLAAG